MIKMLLNRLNNTSKHLLPYIKSHTKVKIHQHFFPYSKILILLSTSVSSCTNLLMHFLSALNIFFGIQNFNFVKLLKISLHKNLKWSLLHVIYGVMSHFRCHVGGPSKFLFLFLQRTCCFSWTSLFSLLKINLWSLFTLSLKRNVFLFFTFFSPYKNYLGKRAEFEHFLFFFFKK